MSLYFSTQGFVFKKIDIGEADRFYSVFTKDFGRLELFAKGVRKMTSKLKSPMEPPVVVELEFVQGKQHKTLIDTKPLLPGRALKTDLEKLALLLEISGLFDRMIIAEDKNELLWQLTQESLENFAKSRDRTKIFLLYFYFVWNFLRVEGYAPDLSEKLKSVGTGNVNALKLLRALLNYQWDVISRIKISTQILKPLAKITQEYLTTLSRI